MKTIKIPHKGTLIEFSTIEFPEGIEEECRGDYMSIQPAIREKGFRPPTISEVVSLVYDVLMNPERPDYNTSQPGRRYSKLNHLLYSGCVYGFTGNLFVPGEGVYIEDHPELNIPNTTNSLDGSFKKVKNAIAVHSGLTQERKLKLVMSLIMKIR